MPALCVAGAPRHVPAIGHPFLLVLSLAILGAAASCGSARPPLPRLAPAIAATPTPTPTPTEIRPTPTAESLSVAPPAPASLLGQDASPLATAALRLVERAARQRAAGDTAAARETLERAVEVDPSCGFAYYDLAALHLDQGNNDLSIAFADKALVVGGSYGNEWLSHAQVLLGRALQANGDETAAVAAYRRALALHPGNLPARIALQGLP
jgi:tetratricopeptide (TPR) repeat protein